MCESHGFLAKIRLSHTKFTKLLLYILPFIIRTPPYTTNLMQFGGISLIFSWPLTLFSRPLTFFTLTLFSRPLTFFTLTLTSHFQVGGACCRQKARAKDGAVARGMIFFSNSSLAGNKLHLGHPHHHQMPNQSVCRTKILHVISCQSNHDC